MYIVLVYDISQDEKGQRRWSRVFKICKNLKEIIINPNPNFASILIESKWNLKTFFNCFDGS